MVSIIEFKYYKKNVGITMTVGRQCSSKSVWKLVKQLYLLSEFLYHIYKKNINKFCNFSWMWGKCFEKRVTESKLLKKANKKRNLFCFCQSRSNQIDLSDLKLLKNIFLKIGNTYCIKFWNVFVGLFWHIFGSFIIELSIESNTLYVAHRSVPPPC